MFQSLLWPSQGVLQQEYNQYSNNYKKCAIKSLCDTLHFPSNIKLYYHSNTVEYGVFVLLAANILNKQLWRPNVGRSSSLGVE